MKLPSFAFRLIRSVSKKTNKIFPEIVKRRITPKTSQIKNTLGLLSIELPLLSK